MKKLIAITAIILSQSGFCESSAVATLYPFNPDIPLPVGHDGAFDSHHAFNIDNKTGIQQAVDVCYDLTTCENFPDWMRSIHDCTSYYIPPGQNRNGQRDLHMVVNYPVKMTCKVAARTEIKYYSPQMVIDMKSFEIR